MGNRKCVVRERKLKNSYYVKNLAYTTNLYEAEFFDENEIPNDIKKNPNNEIIYLDSKEGLELLVEGLLSLNRQISESERKLSKMKEGREKLINANPEMLAEYEKICNSWYHEPTGISKEDRKKIIERVVNSKST